LSDAASTEATRRPPKKLSDHAVAAARDSNLRLRRADTRCVEIPLVLRHSRQDVHGELIGVGIIDGDEFDARFHDGGNEGDVTGEAIELGDDEPSLVPAAVRCRK
jgi:hypothetical protein